MIAFLGLYFTKVCKLIVNTCINIRNDWYFFRIPLTHTKRKD
jgi:hypothetical protein